MKIQKRVWHGYTIFEYYANNQWEFNNDGSMKARELLNPRERELYKIDGNGLDLEEYFYNSTRCARLYILKEPDHTIPRAKIHLKVLVNLEFFLNFHSLTNYLFIHLLFIYSLFIY